MHIAIRQCFASIPAISKIFYKSANNDTVKGFDAVHVVGPPDDMELWLGEAKYYNNFTRAARDVVKEIKEHTKSDYLRDEFVLIKNKLDVSDRHASQLETLLSPGTSLDTVFTRICIPVLITYDSAVVKKHDATTDAYIAEFCSEILSNKERFDDRLPGTLKFRIHLFLLPLEIKAELTAIFDEELKTWQNI